MRWVHIGENGPINMVAKEDEWTDETRPNYKVRWYRYRVGAAAADSYSSVYWDRIEDVEGFTCTFNPDVNKAIENVKAIVVYEENTPYRSNELVFTNDEEVQPSEEL